MRSISVLQVHKLLSIHHDNNRNNHDNYDNHDNHDNRYDHTATDDYNSAANNHTTDNDVDFYIDHDHDESINISRNGLHGI
jgi:hypothetical protein